MEKRRIIKDDGRYLIFYSFPSAPTNVSTGQDDAARDPGTAGGEQPVPSAPSRRALQTARTEESADNV